MHRRCSQVDMTTQRFKPLQGNVDAIYYNEKLYIGKERREYLRFFNENTNNFDLYYHLAGKDINLSPSIWTRRKTCGWEPPAIVFTACRLTSNSFKPITKRKHSQHLKTHPKEAAGLAAGRKRLTVSAQTALSITSAIDPKRIEQYMFRILSEAAVKIIWEIYGSELSTA